ncbi:MAG: YARHG domain-containing protein, partial [Proteocatella sp.]
DVRICQTVEDAIGEYVDEAKIITSGVKQKNSKAKSIEEDFLSSIGTPFMASADMKEAVKIEDKLLYGSKDDFDDSPCVKLTQDEKEAFLTDASVFFDEESSSLQNHELPKASTENNNLKVDEQVMHIANELELQNQLANETASDVQLKSKEKKTASNQRSNGAESQYVKNLTINKSGGKITELEFEHTQEPLLQAKPKPKVKKHNPEIKNQSPEAKEPVPKIKNQAPEMRKQNKKPSSSNSKKTKKKKKSKTPAVLTAVISIALVFVVFGIFKSGIFNNPDVVPQTPVVTQSNPEANNEDINASTDNTAETPSTDADVSDPDGAISDTKSDSNADTTGTSDIAGSEYILPSDTRLLTFDDLEGMDKSEIRFAINEMYARRGWHFDNGGDYYTYFSEKSWYKPDSKLQTPTDASTKFTETENVNLATIVKYRDTLS